MNHFAVYKVIYNIVNQLYFNKIIFFLRSGPVTKFGLQL